MGKEGDSNNIKVCVRCRPFISREKGETCAVGMPTKTTVTILKPEGGNQTFNYDRAYWSHSEEDPQNGFATQQTLMDELGAELLRNAIEGYNDTLFAYGQTGSGKTWSVIGGKDMATEGGLLPRMINQIFLDIAERSKEGWTFHCKVSYLEIYNDALKDLLDPSDPSKNNNKHLDVRQHPTMGTFVPGLTESPCTSAKEVDALMDFGMKSRTVAATSMNDRSSRSHCIFTFKLEQVKGDERAKSVLRSKINLVDLAGSERQKKTEATGARLKEGAQINQSLTNLALVIGALAKSMHDKKVFVPFRNSKLTYLLQESLVGNSKTVMIAAVSPAASNFDETMSTLRFANSVKEIKTNAKVNKESDGALIADLRAEIERLKAQQAESSNFRGSQGPIIDENTQAQLDQYQKMIDQYGANWQEQLEEAKKMEEIRNKALVSMGVSGLAMAQAMDIPPETPYLMNIADDPHLSGCLMYFVPLGKEVTLGSGADCTLKVKGLGVHDMMCTLVNKEQMHVKIIPVNVNGKPVGRMCKNGRLLGAEGDILHAGDRFMLGRALIFRLCCPLSNVEPDHHHSEHSAVRDEHLAEIVDEESEQYVQCKQFIDSISSQIGPQVAGHFLQAYAKALPLVQEAQEITNLLRKSDHLCLRLDAVYDVMAFQSAEPMLCVRLWKKEAGIAKMRRVAKDVWNANRMRKMRIHDIAHFLTGLGDDDSTYCDGFVEDCRAQLIGVWSWRSFLIRLSGMRDIYDEYLGGFATEMDPHKDPWAEVTYLDLAKRHTISQAHGLVNSHEEEINFLLQGGNV